MVGAIALGTSVLPKVLKGGLKLFSGIGEKVGNLFGANKEQQAQNQANLSELFQKVEAKKQEFINATPEQRALLIKKNTNQQTMENEQNYDSGENTQKAFLGLQSVEAGKKQQSKIIMIAGAVILLLFFMMKKK